MHTLSPTPSTHESTLLSHISPVLSLSFFSYSHIHIFLLLHLILPHSTHFLEFAGCKPMKTTKVSVAGRSNLTVNFEEELWIPVWYGINFFVFVFTIFVCFLVLQMHSFLFNDFIFLRFFIFSLFLFFFFRFLAYAISLFFILLSF